jgi:hypothetical protein
MSERKTDSIKLIGNAYQIVKPLFQVGSYFYAQGNILPYPVCCLTNNYEVSNAALVTLPSFSTYTRTRTLRKH